mmetsp:Transcript_34862/g.80297  ORF Transcript_34862/g.80297 Transcript_34862/m.80297 type:complete len:511 (-) Transcript_34862:818-2350(-)
MSSRELVSAGSPEQDLDEKPPPAFLQRVLRPETCLAPACPSQRQRLFQIQFICLQQQVGLLLFPLRFFLLLMRLQLACKLLGLKNCLAAGALFGLVLLSRHFDLLSNHSWLPQVESILQLGCGPLDSVKGGLGQTLLHGDPCVFVLLRRILDPLVLIRQARQVLDGATIMLHEPLSLTLVLLVRMDEGRIIEVRRLQARRPGRTFGRLHGRRPAPQRPQGRVGVLDASFQLTPLKLGLAAVGVDHRALLLAAFLRHRVQGERFRDCLLVIASCTSQCLICLLLLLEDLPSLLHPLQVLAYLLSLFGLQTLAAQGFLEGRFRLLEGSQPQVGDTHPNLHAGAHLLILRIGGMADLPSAGFVPEVQDLDGSGTVLQALGEVAQVQRSNRAVGKTAGVGRKLQGLCVGIVSTLVVPRGHELVALVFEPDGITFISVIPFNHWRSVLSWSILGKGRSFAPAITDRNTWSRSRRKADANLPGVLSHIRNILLCVFQLFWLPDTLVLAAHRGGRTF